MGARLQGAFYGEEGTRIGVTIDDAEFSGTAVDFDCLSLEIVWRGDDSKERFSPIIGSECKMSLLINNADLEDFIEDLVNAVEGRFTVTVATSDGITVQTRWCGYITTDLASIEDTPLEVGYAANLSAVDGLGVLKGLTYSSNALYPYTGYATIAEHLLNCINRLGFVSTYYGNLVPILRTVCNWHSSKWTYSSSLNPLSNSRINHTAFWYRDNKGNYRFSTCYEVLEQIATAFGARIFFSGQSFWFIQVNQMQNANSNTVFTFLSDGTESTEGADLRLVHNQANPVASDLLRFSGGFFQFFAPIESVQVDYKHIQTRNLLAGVSFVNGSPVDYTNPNPAYSTTGDTKLSFSSQVRLTTNYQPTPFEAFFVQFKLSIRIGAYYYVGGDGTDPGWTTSAGFYYFNSPVISYADYEQVFSVSFITLPLIAGVSGDFIFAPSIHKAFKLDFTEVTIDPAVGLGLLLSWEMFNNYMEVVEAGTFDEQSDLLRYINTNNAYATKKVQTVVQIGDGPNTVTPGHIEAYTGTNWEASDGWRVGNSGAYKPHSRLLANEIIRGNITSVKRLTGFSFKNLNAPYLPLQPHLAIYYNSDYYLCQSGSWNLKNEIFSGDWYKLQTATGYTEQDVQYIPEGSDSGVPTSTGSGSTGSGGGGGTSTGGGSGQPAVSSVAMYSEEFIGATSNVLTITENGGVLPGNLRQIDVLMNGQDLVSSQWTTGSGTITIDTDTHYDGANYKVRFLIVS